MHRSISDSLGFARDLHRAGALALAAAGLMACTPTFEPEPPAFRQAQAQPLTLSLGKTTTCVTTTGGEAKCWGQGDAGRLGQGQSPADGGVDPTLLPGLSLGQDAIGLQTNGAQSYALLADGSVRAFGLNDQGQLGLGHTESIGDDETPAGTSLTTIVPLVGPATQVVVGDAFACARLVGGQVACWGRGDAGQLGRGVQPGMHGPAPVSLGGTAVEITAGVDHACARLDSGAIRCWGEGGVGQLGYGFALDDHHTPATAGDVPLGAAAVQVVAGGAHTCARLLGGAVRCWGDNTDGQLGLGHTEDLGDDEPASEIDDVELDGEARWVVAGASHTCALLDDDTLRCWGAGNRDQLGLVGGHAVGDDETPISVDPVDMGGHGIEAIFAGALADHTCAQLSGGALRCWGHNDHGQVGLGYTSPLDPVEGPPGDLPDVIIVEDPDV